MRILLRRVRADGTGETDPRVLTSAGPATWTPTPRLDVATNGRGQTLVAFLRSMPGPYPSIVRTELRAITVGAAAPNGTACTQGSECGTGECVDGLCCSTRCAGACEVCSVADGAESDGTCIDRCRGDAGMPDAGAGDAATRPDASPSPLHELRSGLCSASPAHGSHTGLLALALALAARSRRATSLSPRSRRRPRPLTSRGSPGGTRARV